MILLLGASGYIGQAFVRELERRRWPFVSLSRKQKDYSRFNVLVEYLKQNTPEFVVNAAGYAGKPNVDVCEELRAETLIGNTLLPDTIAQACLACEIPWGHVSSGCVYAGAKTTVDGRMRVEKDLTRSEVRALVESSPQSIQGFTEEDQPNFSFDALPCSFYSGTKALAEAVIAGLGRSYLWRLRIPFDEFDHTRNFLTKIQRYPKVYDNVNSISHRADFARACLDLWERRATFGTYNITNPGFITTREVVGMIQQVLQPKRRFEFWASDEEFYRSAAKAPRSNCVLDVSKLLATGVRIRPVREALAESLRLWRPAPAPV